MAVRSIHVFHFSPAGLRRVDCSLLNYCYRGFLDNLSTMQEACAAIPMLQHLLSSAGAAATLPTWGVRPQMFSLLFASIFISLLDKILPPRSNAFHLVARAFIHSLGKHAPGLRWVWCSSSSLSPVCSSIGSCCGKIRWLSWRADATARLVDDCHRCSSLS